MAELGELSFETFSGHIGEPFGVASADAGVEIEPGASGLTFELIEAVSLGAPMTAGMRGPFSLLFRGPSQPILPQAIYRLTHDQLGSLDLFLVPLQPETDGARYQAVFN
jgi:hypothetical protein